MTHNLTGGHAGEAAGSELLAGLAVAALIGSDLVSLTAPVDCIATAGGVDMTSQLMRCDWWQAAGMTEIVAVYEAACAQHDVDPAARRAVGGIWGEVFRRYGVDVLEPRADPAAVSLAVAERARVEHEAAALDLAEAAQAATRADADMRHGEADAAAAHLDQSDQLYRRADLRRRLARCLESALARATSAP